jgi:hypothetical protein
MDVTMNLTKLRLSACLFTSFAFLSACTGTNNNGSGRPVSVVVAPMAVHTSYFKDKQSNDFRSLDQSVSKDPNFDAFTLWFYHCFADFQTEDEHVDDTAGASSVRLKIKSLQVRLSCPVTVWMSHDASALVRAHEKGHVFICRKIYDIAPAVVREAASGVVGMSFNGMGSNIGEARRMAVAQAEGEIAQAFRDKVVGRADQISINYDRLCYDEIARNDQSEATQQKNAEESCQQYIEP